METSRQRTRSTSFDIFFLDSFSLFPSSIFSSSLFLSLMSGAPSYSPLEYPQHAQQLLLVQSGARYPDTPDRFLGSCNHWSSNSGGSLSQSLIFLKSVSWGNAFPLQFTSLVSRCTTFADRRLRSYK